MSESQPFNLEVHSRRYFRAEPVDETVHDGVMRSHGDRIADSRVAKSGILERLYVLRPNRVWPQRQDFDVVKQRACRGIEVYGVQVTLSDRVALGSFTAFAEDPPPVGDQSEHAVVER